MTPTDTTTLRAAVTDLRRVACALGELSQRADTQRLFVYATLLAASQRLTNKAADKLSTILQEWAWRSEVVGAPKVEAYRCETKDCPRSAVPCGHYCATCEEDDQGQKTLCSVRGCEESPLSYDGFCLNHRTAFDEAGDGMHYFDWLASLAAEGGPK